MTLAGCLLSLLLASSATPEPGPPCSHLWIVNELFSSSDGTIQFVELWECCGSTIETQMGGKKVYSDTTGNTFTFPANITGNTAYRYLLLGTAAFAALPGAPTPDYIIPSGFFSTGGDTIRWHVYPNATLAFTGGQLPTDGIHSLNYDGSTGINSPRNYAGLTGTVNTVFVPALPLAWMAVLVGGALLGGWVLLRGTQPRAEAA